MNPFDESPKDVDSTLMDWAALYPAPYDKRAVAPYTRARVILMNGSEFEAVWFLHQFARHARDNDLKRELAAIRRSEQQQQKLVSCLKPASETMLEHTIGYEQLEVDLTAAMARREPGRDVKRALDFALLEDFDHLYRFANLLDLEQDLPAENITGGYTEIMPGRPSIAEHRHPRDSVRQHGAKTDSLLTKLDTAIITAAEQQAMNYYMHAACAYPSDTGRKLYQEIGMIEEDHLSQYESLIDPDQTWLENLLMHQYAECYLYYSCLMSETDGRVKAIWARCFEQELAHLFKAAELLRRYEDADWRQLIPGGEFPPLLTLSGNSEYIRSVLAKQVELTAVREVYAPVDQLLRDFDFFMYQQKVNHDVRAVPSHQVIRRYIQQNGVDYRFEQQLSPIERLQDRRRDETGVGREADGARWGAPPPAQV